MFDSLRLAAIPPEDEALRPKIRAFLDDHLAGVPLPQRARTWMGGDVAFSRAMGQAGFLGLTLPEKYGGGGRGPFARFVVVEELLSAGAPVGLHWIADRQSALLILKFGTEAQRQFYLPAICRGELLFSIGMSEPGAGSDLAAVRTRAERQPDGGWRLNGQKVWTSGAHLSDYAICLVRTSGTSEDRHAGLSQLIVPLKAKGVTIRPIIDLNGDHDFNEVFFDDVDLPADALIGDEGDGWKQVNAELAFERSGPERIYSSLVLFDAWLAHVRANTIDQGRERLAGATLTELATLRQLSIAITAQLAAGESPATEAALVKDLGTSFEQALPAAIADDLAAHPDEQVSPELAATVAQMLAIAPAFSLRGGTREILRGMIARGLGLR